MFHGCSNRQRKPAVSFQAFHAIARCVARYICKALPQCLCTSSYFSHHLQGIEGEFQAHLTEITNPLAMCNLHKDCAEICNYVQMNTQSVLQTLMLYAERSGEESIYLGIWEWSLYEHTHTSDANIYICRSLQFTCLRGEGFISKCLTFFQNL